MKRAVSLWAALALLPLAALAGCADGERRPKEIVAHAAMALPNGSAQDWVTYGDHLVRFRAVSEFRGPAAEEEIKRQEGLRLRHLRMEIGEVLWTRPSLVKRSSLPRSMTIEDGGWIFHGDEEIPLRIEGQPKIEVGMDYLGVMTYAALGANGKANWLILAHIPFVNGTAKLPSDGPVTQGFSRVAGKSVGQVAGIFDVETPDPAARSYMSDDPQARYNKVAARR